MKHFGKLLMAGALAVGFGIPGAMAATQGTLGLTSTGTSLLSLTIAAQYRVSGLVDFALGTYGGTGNLTGNSDLCVYTNGAGTYNVRITDNSTMSGAGFSVQNAGATAQIAYSVDWNDVAGLVGTQAAAYNTQLASTGANLVAADCSTGGNSANLRVTLLQAALQAAPTDTYSTTISVLIEP